MARLIPRSAIMPWTSHASGRLETPQSIPDSIPTTLVLDTEEVDTEGYFDPPSEFFTIPIRGVYMLFAGASWAANAVGIRQLEISLGLGFPPAVDRRPAMDVGETQNFAGRVWICNIGQQIYVNVLQTSGDALDIIGGDLKTFLSIVYLGPATGGIEE